MSLSEVHFLQQQKASDDQDDRTERHQEYRHDTAEQ